jgi:hypothetical protein
VSTWSSCGEAACSPCAWAATICGRWPCSTPTRPGSDPRGAWYDELLVSGSTVVVVGYSYARGGTEIGLFELARDGALSYRATYHLRSFDYYSSRNYASRLVDGKLVFYTPTLLQPWGNEPLQPVPGPRRWGGVDRHVPAAFERILPATRVFRTDDDFDPAMPLALHTVTQCELGGAHLRCEASAVLGPAGRVFYVSTGSVYVWTTGTPRWPRGPRPARRRPQSALFRLPLDGAAPSAIKTAGVPVDQMSFLEDREGHLSVLLREAGDGEGMWGAERQHGPHGAAAPALVGIRRWTWRSEQDWYRRLPGPNRGEVQNRHVGDWLIWGGEEGAWAYARRARCRVALAPSHAVERIEALGEHALLVGQYRQRTALQRRAPAARPRRAGRQPRLAGARQGETRTHGFFYRPPGVMKDCWACLCCPEGHARSRLAQPRGARGLPASPRSRLCRAGRTGQRAHWAAGRRLQGLLRGLVRQCAAHLPGSARAGPDGLRAGRRAPAGERRRERIETRRSISFSPTAHALHRLRPTPFD